MRSDDLKNAPKTFAESINIAFTPEFFVMGISSGEESTVFSLTPQHAKRLQKYLTHQINEYEKEHQTIVADWKPTIVSPVQRRNPPMEGS